MDESIGYTSTLRDLVRRLHEDGLFSTKTLSDLLRHKGHIV